MLHAGNKGWGVSLDGTLPDGGAKLGSQLRASVAKTHGPNFMAENGRQQADVGAVHRT